MDSIKAVISVLSNDGIITHIKLFVNSFSEKFLTGTKQQRARYKISFFVLPASQSFLNEKHGIEQFEKKLWSVFFIRYKNRPSKDGLFWLPLLDLNQRHTD